MCRRFIFYRGALADPVNGKRLKGMQIMKNLAILLFIVVGLQVPVQGANPTFAEALKGAKNGDARSQYIVGTMYLFGHVTKQNVVEAARWIEASAKSGLPQALVALSQLYDVGKGVPMDRARALELRQQAARAGNATARGQIEEDRKMPGQAEFRRASVLYDLNLVAEAIPHAKLAMAAGSANAQYFMGRVNHFGMAGMPVNLAEAVRLYRLATEGGVADASRGLAYMYEFGLGVRVDRKMALVYYDRSAGRGNELAKRAAANLRSPDYDQPLNHRAGGNTPGSQCSNGYDFNYASGSCSPMYPGMQPYFP